MILLNKTSCNHKVYKGQIALGDTKFKFIFSSTGSNLNYSWYTDPPSYSSKEEYRLDWSKGGEGFLFSDYVEVKILEDKYAQVLLAHFYFI